ncbi:hypothetical protein ACFYXD_35285 [Streptomyces platensis]|uniref:hypothetical protein n=1 Tax=Streptomyces platensis TaxID=58346 RepID=UPI0036851B23
MTPAGRPEVGPKVEVRLHEDTLTEVDALAERTRSSRADTLRYLITHGLESPHEDPTTDPTALEIEQTLDTDNSCGIEVYSNGRTYWVRNFETGQVYGNTTDPVSAAAMQGAALVAYEAIRLGDTLGGQSYGDSGDLDYDPSEIAYPDLVQVGRDILADLPKQAEALKSAAKGV